MSTSSISHSLAAATDIKTQTSSMDATGVYN